MTRIITIKNMAAGAILAACGTTASAQVFTWTGGAGNDWSDAASWTPFGIPDGPAAQVFINNGVSAAHITLDSPRTVGTLEIGDNDSLAMFSGDGLTVAGGSIINDGLVRQVSSTFVTALDLAGPITTLSGAGVWTLNGADHAVIRAATPGNSLTNAFGHTITGAGRVGDATQLGIVNNGTIVSVFEGEDLVIAPGTSADVMDTFDLVNNATGVLSLNADGARLIIRDADVLNRGQIRKDSGVGSDIRIEHATITNTNGVVSQIILGDEGHLIGGVANGYCRSQPNASTPATIEGVTINDQFVLQGVTRLRGTLTLPAADNFLRIVNWASVDTPEGVSIEGNGGVTLTGNVRNESGAASSLRIGFGVEVIADSATIGAGDDLGVLNAGTIRVDDTVSQDTDVIIETGRNADVLSEYDLANQATGRIEVVADHTTLVIRDSDVLNRGAIDASVGINSNIRIEDATVTSTGAGHVDDVTLGDGGHLIGGRALGYCRTQASASQPAVLQDLAVEGQFVFQGPTTLRGTIDLPNADSRLLVSGFVNLDTPEGATLAGDGSVRLTNQMRNVLGARSTLVVGPSVRVDAEGGQMGANDAFGIINYGVISTNEQTGSGLPLVIDTGVNANADGPIDFHNAGTLGASDGIDTILHNMLFDNDGLVAAGPNSAVIFETTATVNQHPGSTLTGGAWRADGPVLQPSRVELPGSPITTIGSQATVELLGPVGRIVAGGVDLDDSLRSNLGTLRLLEGANFIAGGSIENSGKLELGLGGDVLGLGASLGFTQLSAGTLIVRLGGVGAEAYGQIDMAGPVSLDGELAVTLADGFEPQAGDSFTIIVGDAGVAGAFTIETLPVLSGGLEWSVVYAPTQVRLEVSAGACPADLAEPFGVLDFTDVLAFLTAFGSEDPVADMAEPFGVFDFTDVLAFLSSFSAGCP
ncbi:MAG: GC-type dockerin domain-anchored protein [Phycisphaerales bacterium JB059]